jgi:hypothetical protein
MEGKTGRGKEERHVHFVIHQDGPATVVRASLDRPALAQAMGLRADQRITLVQSVGYPKP